MTDINSISLKLTQEDLYISIKIFRNILPTEYEIVGQESIIHYLKGGQFSSPKKIGQGFDLTGELTLVTATLQLIVCGIDIYKKLKSEEKKALNKEEMLKLISEEIQRKFEERELEKDQEKINLLIAKEILNQLNSDNE